MDLEGELDIPNLNTLTDCQYYIWVALAAMQERRQKAAW